MQFNYDIALPNINTSIYTPRGVTTGMLRKINEIAVDTSPLNTPQGLMIPGPERYARTSAMWVSAKINGAKHGDVSFLGEKPNDGIRNGSRGSRGLYDDLSFLNLKAKDHGFVFALQLIDKWERVLLALAEGYTVMIGGAVYESFDPALSNGIVHMPAPGEALLGGHMVNLISFDQKEDLGVAIGNLGTNVGRRGLLKYRGSYFRNLAICRDFYVLTPRIEHAN